jgi:HAE1 family hydrophobic/amphiphilic exporter-1
MKTLKTIEDKIFSKINPAVNFSVTRYVLAIGIFVAIVVFGFVCTVNLGVDLLPSVTIPSVSIQTSFPGANPQVIDQQITKVIEDALSTMSGISDMSASSSNGSSRVSVSFGPNSDRNAMVNQVATIIATVARRLPSGASTPVVQTFDPNSQPIMQFGISSNKESLDTVADYVNNTLGPELERLDGVANVSFDGAPSKQFQVLLNPDKLKYYGITPQQVVSGITNTSVNTPIGTIVRANSTLTFATQNIAEGIDNIRRAIVDSSRGITVDDIGSVRNTVVSQNIARVNGIPVVLVSLQRTTDSNSVKVADSVRAAIEKMNLPSSYKVVFSNDTTGPIRASIDSTFRELIMTLVVVAFIVLLFLGRLNTAFSVILAIPIALAAAPILYQFLGFSFNLVSLLALIIAIGVVVDDSIVVAENVARYRAKGLGLKESVLKGASEVFSAIVAASLSLLAVLIPVSFVGGFIARYLMQFSLGLAAAVLFSLLEAILFLTVRLAYTPEGTPHTWIDFFKSELQKSARYYCRDRCSVRTYHFQAILVASGAPCLSRRIEHRQLRSCHSSLFCGSAHRDTSRNHGVLPRKGEKRICAFARKNSQERDIRSRRSHYFSRGVRGHHVRGGSDSIQLHTPDRFRLDQCEHSIPTRHTELCNK